MKIGIIIGSLGYGGAEKVSTKLASWWQEHGHEISFYTTKRIPEKEYALKEGINRFSCYCRGKISIIRKLRKTIKADRPNVVLVMDTPVLAFAYPALIFTRIPFFVSERSAPNNAKIKKSTKFLSRLFIKRSKGVIFQTNDAKRCYSKKIQKKSIVLGNPLDVSQLPQSYYGERKKKIVAVGRLVAEKNYPLLIKTFSSFLNNHLNYQLEIYGNGPEKEALIDLSKDLKISSNITFMGNCPDVLNKINDAMMFVLTSDFEGMPNALIEAMALGIPCISTDCPTGGPAALINNEKNGLLVPVGSSNSLLEAMCRIDNDPNLSIRLSNESKKIKDVLHIDIIAKQWLVFFDRMIKK